MKAIFCCLFFEDGRNQKGFTLIELLVVAVIVGLTAAFAAPSWTSFVEGRRLTAGRDRIYSALSMAQVKSQGEKRSWQFSLRERDDVVEFAVHPRSVRPEDASWERLEEEAIRVDAETTFASSGGAYYVRFDERGEVSFRLGRMTLSSERAPRVKRCVIVSTMIGAMRKSQQQSQQRDGRFCY